MKANWLRTMALTGLGLLATASLGRAGGPGDIPGPIDSLSDLQDTGRMLFKMADENNDGQISQKEAVDAGNLLVGGFFFRADANGDGVLSRDEVRQARDSFLADHPSDADPRPEEPGRRRRDPGLACGQRRADVRAARRHEP